MVSVNDETQHMVIKYEIYLYDKVQAKLVKNLPTTLGSSEIYGSNLNNKYLQYTNCLKSHQAKKDHKHAWFHALFRHENTVLFTR